MRIVGRRRPLLVLVVSVLVTLTAASCDTGDTLTFEVDPYEFGFELNEPPAEDPCDVDWHQVGVDTDLAGSLPTTTEVTGVDVPEMVYRFAGQWWRLESELYTGVEADNTGSITAGGFWTQNVTLYLTIHDLDGDVEAPATCGPGEQVCELLLHLSLYGAYPDGPLDGSGYFEAGECDSPFASLNGVSATVTDLELT
ncbi:MAG TPA: hypothetical protein VEW93_14735 [Acidimicrobiales bacterium]|nr:hypothetical protein [Acidimicrobiales bacterium]